MYEVSMTIFEISLRIFEFLVPMLFIGAPLAIALAVSSKPHPDYTVEEQQLRSRKYMVGLSLGTSITLLLHFCLWTWPTLAWASLWAFIEFRIILYCLPFIPLWFFVALPLIQTKDPGWLKAPKIQGSKRTANLHSRAGNTRSYWTLFGVVFLAIAAFLVSASSLLPDPQRLTQPPRVLFLTGSLLFLGMGLFFRRIIERKPEPYSSHTFHSMVEEYSRFRATRNIVALLLCSAMALMLVILALLSLITYRDDIVWGWGLAYVLLLFGILGAGARIWSSFSRARLNRMLIQEQNLESANTASPNNVQTTA